MGKPSSCHLKYQNKNMAEPSCKSCKYFDAAIRSNGGECRDKTKLIYPRQTMPSFVEPPWITDGEIYTCENHAARKASDSVKI